MRKSFLRAALFTAAITLSALPSARAQQSKPCVNCQQAQQELTNAMALQNLDDVSKKSECDSLTAYLDQVDPDKNKDSSGIGTAIKKMDFKTFGDLYSEGIHLNRYNTTAGFGQLRYGLMDKKQKLEIYGALRTGADTRTQFDRSAGIYNDNFLFAGVGADYVGILPGVRLRMQIGASTDLSSKIKRGGFDYLAGVITYHEIPLPQMKIVNEIYSEALYIHRYGNFLANLQTRTLYKAFQASKNGWTFSADPIFWTSTSFDSQGLNYNRFIEARMGARFSLRNRKISMAITPHYVVGTRTGGSAPSYRDFRVLATLYCTLPGKR